MRVANDAFLAALAEIYASNSESGSVYVTFKHHDGDTPCCLVRASSNKRKISTLVREPCCGGAFAALIAPLTSISP